MWVSFVKTGAYALAAKQIAEIVAEHQAEIERKRRKSANCNLVLGVAVGGAVGAAMGLLLAPQSGKETREKLVSQASEAVETWKENLAEAAREKAEAARAKACGEQAEDKEKVEQSG
jgi:hypothetical protein